MDRWRRVNRGRTRPARPGGAKGRLAVRGAVRRGAGGRDGREHDHACGQQAPAAATASRSRVRDAWPGRPGPVMGGIVAARPVTAAAPPSG
jgi:hypothetical protein